MAYREMYEIEVQHEGLHKYRLIRGSDQYVVEQKARVQQQLWDEMWSKKQSAQQKAFDRQANKQMAEQLTKEARSAIHQIENTLKFTLNINDAINWGKLKDCSQYNKQSPQLKLIEPTNPPQKTDSKYQIKLKKQKIFVIALVGCLGLIFSLSHDAKGLAGLLSLPILLYFASRISEKIKPGVWSYITFAVLGMILHNISLLFSCLCLISAIISIPLRKKEIEKKENQFTIDNDDWIIEKEKIKEKNEKIEESHKNDLIKWEEKKQAFYANQKQCNALIDERKKRYLNKDVDAILDYCDMVLSNSIYPDNFPQEYDIEYNPENKIIIVEYSLPTIEDMPNIKEVKYIATKNELKESYLTESTIQKMYDKLLYQITLRTMHELYEADLAKAIESIIFNGWVRSIDKSTGQEVNACILSVQSNKEEFLQINLELVDPKECFKKLKGIGSSKLYGLSPIQPIININRQDKRFVSSYEVADSIDCSTNLAIMDWQDFENLIREVFEKEFNQSGGEVKITQASRDGGVDAVAFDPDPIRGGKIVIQAKRYTNPVGVSAVRDLYGTLMNEGATKGILVTTSDYGPDAYEFAKGKPITLLNGNNLLYLLEKHGHQAKIDIKEAKQILNPS